jgi:hypothetical protein
LVLMLDAMAGAQHRRFVGAALSVERVSRSIRVPELTSVLCAAMLVAAGGTDKGGDRHPSGRRSPH